VAGWAQFLVEQGWVAVNINYRLITQAPYPAALQDVLAAVRWIQETDQAVLCRQDRGRMALLGGSAGGFLVMMAGLILGQEQIRSIVSISGPSQYSRSIENAVKTEGTDPRMFSPPIELVGPEAPPLLCTHSRNDTLVNHQQSVAIIEKMKNAGRCAELYLYDGPNEMHGIWRDDVLPLRLFQHIEDRIASFLQETL
jgi:acetyl esterase/lipase